MKVMIALDESEASVHAAQVAAEVFGPLGAHFTVINVTRVPTPWIGGAGYGVAVALPPDPAWFEPGHDDPAKLIARAVRAGVADADALVDVGEPVEAICSAAHRHSVDIIVVGWHEKSALRRLFDPSVAAGVIRGSDVPVLVVPDTRNEERQGQP